MCVFENEEILILFVYINNNGEDIKHRSNE